MGHLPKYLMYLRSNRRQLGHAHDAYLRTALAHLCTLGKRLPVVGLLRHHRYHIWCKVDKTLAKLLVLHAVEIFC